MRKIILALLLIPALQSSAQKTNRHSPIVQKGFFITFNHHSILEPEEGGVGLGLGYRLNKHIEIWTEFNYLYRGFFLDPEIKENMRGFRNITTFKYCYSIKHGFYVGLDLRIKKYSFNDKNTFYNTSLNDTLVNFNYQSANTLIGAGLFWGKRFKLSGNGKFELEGNVGIGVKQRYIQRRKVPAGYELRIYYPYDRISPIPDNDVEQALPYFPAIVRFIYHL